MIEGGATNCARGEANGTDPQPGETVEDVEHTQRRQTAAASEDLAVSTRLKRQGLFPCEGEIARRLSQSEKRWRGVARQLEREGLPKVDPVMGGRFWPAVVAFFEARYGVQPGRGAVTYPSPPDGPEHWDGY